MQLYYLRSVDIQLCDLQNPFCRGAEDNGLIVSLFEKYADMLRDSDNDESAGSHSLRWKQQIGFLCLNMQYRMVSCKWWCVSIVSLHSFLLCTFNFL